MPNLSAVLRHFPGQRILTIGDLILDRYGWGEASRLSPEAPVPVVRKQRTTVPPGGAPNTAVNLAALGATPLLVGLVGTDCESQELQGALLASPVFRLLSPRRLWRSPTISLTLLPDLRSPL